MSKYLEDMLQAAEALLKALKGYCEKNGYLIGINEDGSISVWRDLR